MNAADRSTVPRSAVAGLASLALFGALAVALVVSSARVPAPPGWSWHELETWIGRQPVSATFRLLALGALILVIYLIIATVALLLGAVARAARVPWLGHAAEIVAVPVIQRALATLLGLGMTMSAGPPSAHAGSGRATVETVLGDESGQPGRATMHLLPAPASETRTVSPAGAPPAVRDPNIREHWTIEPGDHLWGLASTTLRASWNRAPSDREIGDYVQSIIDLNGDAFVVPGQPDLVFPGQVFVRPPVN